MYSIPEIASQMADKMSKSDSENAKTIIFTGSKSVVSYVSIFKKYIVQNIVKKYI